MKVLLVTDDAAIAAPLVDGLTPPGLSVAHVTTGAAALDAGPHDLILLDPRLPGLDGLGARLRRDGDLPMIMMTVPGGTELIARVLEVARRAPAENPVRTYGPLAIDSRSRQIRLHGVPISLAPKEYDLLVLLAADPGAVVARRHILETVWEPDFTGPGRTLDFHVASLRRKLGGPGWIENRRGVGFRLVVPA